MSSSDVFIFYGDEKVHRSILQHKCIVSSFNIGFLVQRSQRMSFLLHFTNRKKKLLYEKFHTIKNIVQHYLD